MTDRELLEAAAKAAGLGFTVPVFGVPPFMGLRLIGGAFWNPLTNSGDAFELAVKLRLTINCSYEEVAICGQEFTQKDVFIEYNKEDANAATRRAVVRAAAAIGKEMKDD
jgi:hypothetical protein